MPVTIGLDDSAGLGAALLGSATEQLMMDEGSFVGVLPAGEKFTLVGMYGSTAVANFEVGIYDITSGVPNAPLLVSATVTTTGTDLERVTVAIPPSGTVGNTYAIAWRAIGDSQRCLGTFSNQAVSVSNTLSSSVLDATFDDAGNQSSTKRAFFAVSEVSVTGPTITAPDTIQDGAATTITGTELATVTTVNLDEAGSNYLVDNTSNATLGGASIAWTPETNFASVSTLPTVPFTDATLHTGAVAPVVRLVVSDGVTPATRNVTNTTPTGYTSHQFGTVAGMTTTAGSGAIGDTDYIATLVDDFQFTTETTVSGVTLVFDALGNWSMDATSLANLIIAGSVDFQWIYIMPDTGNTSSFVQTISAPGTLPPVTFDSAYPIRRQTRRSMFHSSLISVENGRAEETVLNAALVTLGGVGLTAPVDGVTATPGYIPTRVLEIFNARIAKVYAADKARVISDLTTALTSRGWT